MWTNIHVFTSCPRFLSFPLAELPGENKDKARGPESALQGLQSGPMENAQEGVHFELLTVWGFFSHVQLFTDKDPPPWPFMLNQRNEVIDKLLNDRNIPVFHNLPKETF